MAQVALINTDFFRVATCPECSRTITYFDRPNGGINIVFLNGSTDKIPLRGLWKQKWHRYYDTNGPLDYKLVEQTSPNRPNGCKNSRINN